MLALTATAAPPVREEIVERLTLHDPAVVVRGFDGRTSASSWSASSTTPPSAAVLDRVAATGGPGIVYVATRRTAEEVAGALVERDVSAAPYHAGSPGATGGDDAGLRRESGLRGAGPAGIFGEPLDGGGNRDQCLASPAGPATGEDDRSGEAPPFEVHRRVRHTAGEGQVMDCEGEVVTVFFPQVGYKTLGLDLVAEADSSGRSREWASRSLPPG